MCLCVYVFEKYSKVASVTTKGVSVGVMCLRERADVKDHRVCQAIVHFSENERKKML